MGRIGLISMPEIAELAGVRRPVVTVWRRRHPDTFPRPAGGDASRPLFDAREVVDWLVATGRCRADIYADLHQHTLSHLGETLGPADLVAYGTALICLRMLDDEPLAGPEPLIERARRVDPQDRMLLSEIRSLPDEADGLPEAMDNLVEAAWGCRPAFERLLADRNRFGAATLSRDAIVPELSRLVAALTGARSIAGLHGLVRVVDPWAGGGELVTALLKEIGEEGIPVVAASTTDEYLTRLLRRRLTVWGVVGEDQEIVTQDASRLRRGEWDVLVARMPYRAVEQRNPEASLDTLHDLATSLHDGQCVVLLAPADILAERLPPRAATKRAEILRTNAVEAIVSLPGGLMPFRPGYRMSLWVLRHDESGRAKGRVMLADVSDRTLTDRLVTDLIEDVTTWRREGYHPAAQRRTVAHTVTIEEILSGASGLSQPRRPDITESVRLGPTRIAELLEIEARLAQQATRPPMRALRSGITARDLGARRTQTIGSLLVDGRLHRLSGTRLRPAHLAPSGHHRVIGVPELTGRDRDRRQTVTDDSQARFIDRVVLAHHYPCAVLTEPGDVVVVLAPHPAAIVDEAGFSVVEFPAAVLRINPEQLTLTPRVLAALVSAAPLAARAPGTTRGARLDQLHLPVLEDGEIAALDTLLRRIEDRRRRAQEEIDTLDALWRTALAGLTDGTLTISTATA
jgi:predicted DNA-binding transcriptional regulator AlpA